MKTCFKCLTEKPIESFYKHKGMKDGVLNKCKDCSKRDVKLNSERVGSAYDFSEAGVFRVIYKNQKRHQRLRGHGQMAYTKSELAKWCKENGFDAIFQSWVDSGYKTGLKPSVDRIDSFNGYSFDNIRLGTWQQNRDAQVDDIMTGRGTSGMKCKPVIKLDKNMVAICEYVSAASAGRDAGYRVDHYIANFRMCKNGFFWVYKK